MTLRHAMEPQTPSVVIVLALMAHGAHDHTAVVHDLEQGDEA